MTAKKCSCKAFLITIVVLVVIIVVLVVTFESFATLEYHQASIIFDWLAYANMVYWDKQSIVSKGHTTSPFSKIYHCPSKK